MHTGHNCIRGNHCDTHHDPVACHRNHPGNRDLNIDMLRIHAHKHKQTTESAEWCFVSGATYNDKQFKETLLTQLCVYPGWQDTNQLFKRHLRLHFCQYLCVKVCAPACLGMCLGVGVLPPGSVTVLPSAHVGLHDHVEIQVGAQGWP